MIHNNYPITNQTKLIQSIVEFHSNNQLQSNNTQQIQLCTNISLNGLRDIKINLNNQRIQTQKNNDKAKIIQKILKMNQKNKNEINEKEYQKKQNRQNVKGKLQNNVSYNKSKKYNINSKEIYGKMNKVQNQNQQQEYRPKINEISRIIIQKSGRKSIVEQLEINKRRKKQKIQGLKKHIQNRKLQNCTFRPKINIISQKVDLQLNKSNQNNSGLKKKRYQILYQNSYVHKIQKYSSLKLNKSNTQYHMPKDHFKQSQHKLPKQINKIHSFQTKSQLSLKNQQNTSFSILQSQEKSSKIQNILKQQLKSIFQTIDKNHDGLINFQDTSGLLIDKKWLCIIFPIFEQMRALESNLQLDQFMEGGIKIWSDLCNEKKYGLFEYRKGEKEEKKMRTQYKQDRQQDEIYEESIYLKYFIQKKEKRRLKQQQKQKKISKYIYQYTFKPNNNFKQ